jgi:hypothetical protein
MYILLVAGAIVFPWFVSHAIDFKFWAELIVLIGVLGAFSWALYRDINKAASRLRELERAINALVGNELLTWENRHGGAVTGYFGRGQPRDTNRAIDQGQR